MTIADNFADRLLEMGKKVRRVGDHFDAQCPAHADREKSLSIASGSDGRLLTNCHAGCEAEAVVAAAGWTMADCFPPKDRGYAHPTQRTAKAWPALDGAIEAVRGHVGESVSLAGTWTYRDATGAEVSAVARFDLPTPEGEKTKKTFRPFHRVSAGWRIGDPAGKWPPYRLSEIAGCTRVYVCEGEKAADAAASCGLAATTSAHGAKSPEKTDWTAAAAAKEVIILPDHDSAGEDYAHRVAGLIRAANPAATVKVLRLADLAGDGFPAGGDFADFAADFRDGHDAESILAEVDTAVDAAEPIKPESLHPATAAIPEPSETPDPEILPIDALDLPDLPFEVLPVWASDFACSLSAAKETPLAMAILLQLAVLASTVQRVYRVRIEPAYHESLCLYSCPAMESGERKTAIYQPIMRPLFDYQKQLRAEASAEIDRVKITRGLAEAELKSLRRKFFAEKEPAARDALQKEIEGKTAALPLIPAMPQLVSEDSTEAALGVTLSNNRESQLVGSDEGGFFDNLASGRFNDVSELDLFLKSHTGSPHTVNRVGRENIYLHRPLLSIAISPQPHVLAALGDKAGFLNRGGLARFLTALPESSVGRRKLLPATIPEDVRRGWSDAVTNLARIGRAFTEEQPSDILLHVDAYREWKTFERSMEPRMGANGDLHGVKPWASKLPGAVARIAAVCHASEWGQDAGRYELPAARMAAAIRLGEAIIPHALAVHRLMGGGGFNVAESVVEFYSRSGWPGESLPLTGWWRPCRSIVGETSKLFEPVADRLVDHGYLIPTDAPQRPGKRGRWFRANRQLVRKSESPCTTKQG